MLSSSVDHDMPDISEVPISKSGDIPSDLTASGATIEDTAVPSSTYNQIPSAKKTLQCKFCKQQYLHKSSLSRHVNNMHTIQRRKTEWRQTDCELLVKGNQVKVPLQLHFIVFPPHLKASVNLLNGRKKKSE